MMGVGVMKERQIFVTSNDQKRLEELLIVAEDFNYKNRDDLKSLKSELDRAAIVDSREVPGTVVTMNTRLRFVDLDDSQKSEVSLVFPSDADVDQDKISVFSPVGTSLLGYSEGDTIEWDVPAGKRRIRIEKIVYQPEAAGDYHL